MIRKDAADDATKYVLTVVLVARFGHVIKVLNLEDEVAKVMSNVTLITTFGFGCEKRGIELINVVVLGLTVWDA